eukprot:jgi/Ulvmu1/1487/UM011_0217.1
MKPGYKKSRKKASKAKRKADKQVPVEDVAMDVDDSSTAAGTSKKQRRKKALAVKQKVKSELLKKTTSKFKKLAARDLSGATNLARSRLGAAELQISQQYIASHVKEQKEVVGDIDMQE